MTQVLPKRHEAQQLCKLRALRVQRAREGVARAQAEVERVQALIVKRQQAIDALRTALDKLHRDVVGSFSQALPRWGEMVGLQRERLADRLERDEYALTQEEQALETAQEGLAAARAELTRALAREDAVRGLAKDVKKAHAAAREAQADRDLEDLGAPRR